MTRVVLPQQSLRDGGTLRVEVVNGFIEDVDATSVPDPVRGRVSQVTAPVVDRAGLTLRELERQLLLARDVSGIALSTALASGRRPGGAVLSLDADYKRVTGFVGFDTFADEDLGRPTLNFGLELNSALNYGETFYARLSTATENAFASDPVYRVGALGALVPIGQSGLTLNLEATASDVRPEEDFAPTNSEFRRQSAAQLPAPTLAPDHRLGHPVARSPERHAGPVAARHRRGDLRRRS